MKFKVGDIVETTEGGRWLVGRIAYIEESSPYSLSMAVEVYNTRVVGYGAVDLHICQDSNTQVFEEPIGYWVDPTNTKLAKSYIVSEILKDL